MYYILKKCILIFAVFFLLINGLFAETEYPAGNYWSLNAGFGMSDILVDGLSYQLVIDPKLWLSERFMIGSKTGINLSFEDETKGSNLSNILTLETQAYLRWNFLKLGRNPLRTINFFVQGGLGVLASYRGKDNPFDDVTLTRGSFLAEGSAGVTIPLSNRWHIEPSFRAGYPHIMGGAVTAGYKFPLRQRTVFQTLPARTEVIQIIRGIPPNEIISRIMISAVEFVLFGPDIGRYNIGIDNDAMGLNELILNHTADLLRQNPNLRARIEGHANPITTDPNEADELMTLSAMRSYAVADQLKARGIRDEQMVVISFGGTRTVTSDQDIWNRNRRVEIIIILVDTN